MLRLSFAVACVCALLYIAPPPAAASRPLIRVLRPPYCYLPKQAGMCLAYKPSWYYDPRVDACLIFIYGGCGGNENRFASRESCEEVCNPGRSVINPWSYVYEDYPENEQLRFPFPYEEYVQSRLSDDYTQDRE